MATVPRVLLVEDDADGAEPLTEVLTLEGYAVTTVADGAAALARLAAETFDVMLIDLGLPDVPGIDVVRAARECPEPPAVIAFTGFHRLRAEAEAAGCDAFVLKPDVDGLLFQLRAIVVARAADAPGRRRSARDRG